MFKNLSGTAIVGLIMEAITCVSMGVLVLLDKPIPDVIAWGFFAGLIITTVPELLKLKK